jgi:hypothetical protein
MPRVKQDDYESMGNEERVSLREIGEGRVKERLEEYYAEFEADSLTTVDRAQIKRMAKLELAADDATDELTSNSGLTPGQRKALSDTAKSLSAEARQLANDLGMSRSKRMTDEEAEQEALIPKLYKEAKDFIYQHAVCIVCPHCRSEKANVEIRAGTIIYHFAFEGEWSWKSKCPRCNQWFAIDQNNYMEFRFDTLNQYEDKEQSSGIIEEDEGDDGQEEI